MGTALELRENAQPVALTSDQLNFISRTEYVPKAIRGNLPAILACVSTGREMGIGDMQALRTIHIIDGKPTFAAELMIARVRAAGHSMTFKADGESCTWRGRRADNGDEGEFTFTLEMAKRAGLIGKDNWKKYPEAMLSARAASQLIRMLFADCLAGVSYTPEELGAGDVTADELMDEATDLGALTAELLDLADTLGVRDVVDMALVDHPDDEEWIREQIASARAELASREEEDGADA